VPTAGARRLAELVPPPPTPGAVAVAIYRSPVSRFKAITLLPSVIGLALFGKPHGPLALAPAVGLSAVARAGYPGSRDCSILCIHFTSSPNVYTSPARRMYTLRPGPCILGNLQSNVVDGGSMVQPIWIISRITPRLIALLGTSRILFWARLKKEKGG
jgi:hypothetical protein